jgi:ABC-type transport system substrate-binding protein
LPAEIYHRANSARIPPQIAGQAASPTQANERTFPMRPALLSAVALLTVPAHAEDTARLSIAAPGPVNVNISYTINAPLTASTPEAATAEDREYRKALYRRAAGECEDLLATIAASCQITNIGVSSQVNRYPGQPATIYVSTNVTMQIALKQ